MVTLEVPGYQNVCEYTVASNHWRRMLQSTCELACVRVGGRPTLGPGWTLGATAGGWVDVCLTDAANRRQTRHRRGREKEARV